MLTIHHSPGTRGFRVMWVCEELGVPYEISPVNFSAEYRRTPEWQAMHPVSKVPVMDDGELRMHEHASARAGKRRAKARARSAGFMVAKRASRREIARPARASLTVPGGGANNGVPLRRG